MERSNHLLRSAAAVMISLASVLLAVTGCGDTDDVETTAGSSAADPDTPTDPDAPVASPPNPDPGAGDPGPPADMGEPVPLEDAEVLVGQTLTDATDDAEARGWSVRVGRIDGEDLALTEDYSPTRINVAVERAGSEHEVIDVLFVG